MAESSQERTEEATPRRRRDARRKGTVAKSQDLVSALAILSLLIVLPTSLSMIGSGLMQGLRVGLGQTADGADFRTIGDTFWRIAQPALGGLALLIGTLMVVGVTANFAQVGFVLSGEALQPSFNKLNPVNGLKRLFSRQAAFEGFKASAKSALFMYLVWSVLDSSRDQLVGLSYLPPAASLAVAGVVLKQIATRIAIAWLILAVVDYIFQRRTVDRQLRMTKEEVKQEMKDAETSAELKGAMARRRRQLSKARLADAMARATVVVTNPTHFAVALEYQQGKQHAPVVVAKGQDFMAFRIRELADAKRVPIVPNPPLARALYKRCEIGEHVPRELFQAVAEVLAYVFKAVKRVKQEA